MLVRTRGRRRRRADLPSTSWRASLGGLRQAGWDGTELQEDVTTGALWPPSTAFIGREAQWEGEGLISFIKSVGRRAALRFPTHKS